jgi:hypothetical protein
MIRYAAAVVLAIILHPALARGQETVLTVDVPSADVYKSATTAAPVIGHVARGTVLPVARNLGSWVKVTWPDGPDGFAYVHVTMGHVGPAGAEPPAAKIPQRATSEPAPQTATMPPPVRAPAGERIAPRAQPKVRTISHILGVGGLVGPMNNFGATARAWRKNRFGFQVAFTRDAITSDVAAGRVTALQVEPAVVCALFDRVSDYIWIRPYVGSGLTFRHETLTPATPITLESPSDNGAGFRVFGGSEITYAGMTQFGLSVEFGYRRLPTPFPGFEPPPLSVTIAGHWYIK